MDIFIEISLIIVIATLISGLVKFLKQPVIIGYILAGLLVGPSVLNLVSSAEALEAFSQFGIALLLFIVGLNLSPSVIREVGKVSAITGIGQVVFTSLIGFGLCLLFGFSMLEAVYIAVALTFSSTIIILKLLSDKGDLDKLYGKISIGFLLVQDIVASLILIAITAFTKEATLQVVLFEFLGKGILLTILLFLITKYILPKISKFFASSQEFLFIFSLAWGMGLASLFYYIGFSIEIGALIAGVTLSMFPYNHEISAKMRPLRDFFLILFFISLGSQLTLGTLGSMMIPAILLSVFVLVGNPLIVIFLMGRLGYSKRTSFLSGLTVAQISEFSLILIALGVRVGNLSDEILSLVTIIGLITITVSSYMIIYSNGLFGKLADYLTVFEVKKPKSEVQTIGYYDVVLFGYNRIGFNFKKAFNKKKYRYLVVDFDPAIIEDLMNKNIECRYGDAGDTELLDELQLDKIKMAISTIPLIETNLLLIDKIRNVNKDAIIMVISHDIKKAYELYKAGASYVILPHFLGGDYASNLVMKHGFDSNKFKNEKDNHIRSLQEREQEGHEHPIILKN